MRFWKLLLPLLALSLSSTLCLAAQANRITGPIDSAQRVVVQGNVHGLAQSRFDIGRADGSKLMHGVTLAFKPSAAQQLALANLLAQQQDRSSPKFHKWLTPTQFADNFGMTQADINQVAGWLESQGFAVTSVANSRNQISFEGTVAQIEAAFNTEIHDYLVDGEIHFANAVTPSVPAAFASAVSSIGHLHNFQPKPHAIVHGRSSVADPHFTSAVSGNHFVTPGDFATIYNVTGLYNGGNDGSGQKIVLTGQSSINLSDVANFRSAAGLPANVPTLLLVPNTGTSTRCGGDEGESDLDVEWSGGVAKNASITLVYAGLASGDSCTGSRQFGAFDALQYAIDQNLAPIISNSYGNCEGVGVQLGEAQTIQAWIQQANAQGQTVISASGDSGAADCDFQVTSATQGLAVDIPAAIPEVTAMGGTEFNGDAEGGVPVNGNVPATQYWSGTTGGTDTISSALSYIPEMGWNDTANSDNAGNDLLASGGGASTFFAKPSWQTGTGVPNDNKRDVPDLALNASPDHDPYLFCSEDGANGAIQASCTNGFRIANGDLTPVGGTSAAAPTFAGIIALINQYMGSSGLGNVNPTLYSLAAGASSPFNDVTTGNNIVLCTSGSTDCPATAPFQYGFSAGTGYDQVTGLGSVDANALAIAWDASRGTSSIAIIPSSTNIFAGTSVSFAVTVSASSSVVGAVSFSTLVNGTSTLMGTATLNTPYPPSTNGTATFSTTSLPAGSNTVTANYMGDSSHNPALSPAITLNVTTPFTLAAIPTSLSTAAGAPAVTTLTITPATGFTGTVTFTNSTVSTAGSCSSGLPAGALCSFSPNSVTLNGSTASTVIMTITTTANMALPTGAQAITVTGISGAASISTPVSLTVTASTETFTLTSGSGVTFPVPTGGTAKVQLTIGSLNGFIVGSGAGATTALPLTYSCSGIPVTAQISCQLPSGGQPNSATAVTINLVTTPVTTDLVRPTMGRGGRMFYALLLPGLFGIVFAVGSRTRSVRMLSLIIVLGCSTVWMGACGGSNNNNNTLKNAGTPPGAYAVTINATTGGANPISSSLAITLNVTAQ